MWQVNFTGRWIWIVNLWTSERHECLRKNNRPMKFFFHVAKTSIFPSNLEHEMRFFKVFPFNFWCMECCLKYTWCAIFLKICAWNRIKAPFAIFKFAWAWPLMGGFKSDMLTGTCALIPCYSQSIAASSSFTKAGYLKLLWHETVTKNGALSGSISAST